jgi:ketosteroid isomerase-like protein
MKWLGWMVPGVALALVSPLWAQSIDPNLRETAERISGIYSDSFSKQNAAPIGELFTQDAVSLSPTPGGAVKTGKEAITRGYEGFMKAGANHIEVNFSQLMPLADNVALGWGDYHVTGQGQSGPLKVDGDWSATYVRDGGIWKIRLLSAIPRPPAPK